jgi:hypothetical protein
MFVWAEGSGAVSSALFKGLLVDVGLLTAVVAIMRARVEADDDQTKGKLGRVSRGR